jgi:hypothetical protein
LNALLTPLQETGNVPFVVENGVGQYSEKPAEIAAIVAEWFGEKKGELIAMKERALKLARCARLSLLVYTYIYFCTHTYTCSHSYTCSLFGQDSGRPYMYLYSYLYRRERQTNTGILVGIALAVFYTAFSFEQRFCFSRIMPKNIASL